MHTSPSNNLLALPPLRSLIAFAAASRHLSFTKAAEELHLTPSAISHQVCTLEDFLGKALFIRTTRQLQLTEGGMIFRDQVQSAVSEIATATQRFRGFEQNRVVTISCTNGISSNWLLPRLAKFREQYPGHQIHVVAKDAYTDFRELNSDLAIYWFNSPPPEATFHVLFDEEVCLVGSPKYLATLPQPIELSSLRDATWLSVQSPGTSWVGWKEWFTSLGLDLPKQNEHLLFSNSILQTQEKPSGIGAAVGPDHAHPIAQASARFPFVNQHTVGREDSVDPDPGLDRK
ncbi:MAG: LysR family transcriptional regulator, partial [Brachymonas sp.]|nr:LysR family transcriptional regulator [Brachymonas sp.]